MRGRGEELASGIVGSRIHHQDIPNITGAGLQAVRKMLRWQVKGLSIMCCPGDKEGHIALKCWKYLG